MYFRQYQFVYAASGIVFAMAPIVYSDLVVRARRRRLQIQADLKPFQVYPEEANCDAHIIKSGRMRAPFLNKANGLSSLIPPTFAIKAPRATNTRTRPAFIISHTLSALLKSPLQRRHCSPRRAIVAQDSKGAFLQRLPQGGCPGGVDPADAVLAGANTSGGRVPPVKRKKWRMTSGIGRRDCAAAICFTPGVAVK